MVWLVTLMDHYQGLWLEKGTTNGVSTDFDGNFQITVGQGSTLEISYTGFLTQSIEIGNQSSLMIWRMIHSN